MLSLGLGVARGSVESATARADESFSWAGCTVAERDGTVRVVTCPAFVLTVARTTTLSDAAGLAAIAASVPGAAGGVPGQLRADETTAPTLESDTVLLAAPLPNAMAACAEPAGARREACRAAMVAMMTSRSLPPGVSFPAARLQFLGADLTVPEGCTAMGPERIGCARTGAAIDWREQAARAGDDAATVVAGIVRVLRSRFAVDVETPVPCTMRGVPGQGLRLRATVSGQPVDFVVCSAVRDGTKSVAQCIGRLPSGGAWPAPCAQVFDGSVP